jgi:hypothetical protein
VPELTDASVGDARKAIAALCGADPSAIDHFVIAADTPEGVILQFCCDDRRHVAAMFGEASRMVLAHRGTSLRDDGMVPPMPGDPK